MVIPILNTLEESRLRTDRKDTEDRERDMALQSQNVDLKALNEFLLRYSPLQLLSDRKSGRRMVLGRRVISSCYYIHLTNTLVRKADSESTSETGGDKLSGLLQVDARSALPHPLWTSKHDATLIRAIAKHGWVDREKSCRAITDDPEIKWGFPFELSSESNNAKKLGKGELLNLRSTADRASSFLGGHSEVVEVLKGCNRHLIIESYGLKHKVNEGENSSAIEWIVDDEMLMQASSNEQDNSREPLDLPVKKDMAKRAKTVLQRSITALESGSRAVVDKSVSTPKNGEQPVNDHGYATIDQGNRCCILLAEMVRGLVKGSQAKNSRQMRMLGAVAYEEALALEKMFSDDKEKAEEMKRISSQIALAKKIMKSSTIPAKNILRVMLGIEPIRNQPLFPSESSFAEEDTTAQKQQTKKEGTRREDGALGEKAIVRAMKKAHDKFDETPPTFNAVDDPEVGLQLTMIEVLLLLAFCLEGIPSTPGASSSPSWDDIGSVLELQTKDYFQIANEKLNKCRVLLMKLEGQDNSSVKDGAAKKVAAAEYEVSTKEEAAQQAVDFAGDPEKLAKKRYLRCILLLFPRSLPCFLTPAFFYGQYHVT